MPGPMSSMGRNAPSLQLPHNGFCCDRLRRGLFITPRTDGRSRTAAPSRLLASRIADSASASLRLKYITFEPSDHTVHDLLVVLLQHHRVTVAVDARFR